MAVFNSMNEVLTQEIYVPMQSSEDAKGLDELHNRFEGLPFEGKPAEGEGKSLERIKPLFSKVLKPSLEELSGIKGIIIEEVVPKTESGRPERIVLKVPGVDIPNYSRKIKSRISSMIEVSDILPHADPTTLIFKQYAVGPPRSNLEEDELMTVLRDVLVAMNPPFDPDNFIDCDYDRLYFLQDRQLYFGTIKATPQFCSLALHLGKNLYPYAHRLIEIRNDATGQYSSPRLKSELWETKYMPALFEAAGMTGFKYPRYE